MCIKLNLKKSTNTFIDIYIYLKNRNEIVYARVEADLKLV